MGAVAQLRIERDAGEGKGPEPFTRRVQLLAGTEESARSNGIVFYSFPAAVRGIIRQSSQYARLQKQVMFAFSSKYALALYEMVQKRGNLKYKTSEEFPIETFRGMLGVETGKLTQFKSFKQRAIDPAVLEVNGLGEFGCKVEPIYTGRKVTAVRLSWWVKNLDERINAMNELRFSRVGRRARLKGEVGNGDAETSPSTHPKTLPLPGAGRAATAQPIPRRCRWRGRRDRSTGADRGPIPRRCRREVEAGSQNGNSSSSGAIFPASISPISNGNFGIGWTGVILPMTTPRRFTASCAGSSTNRHS